MSAEAETNGGVGEEPTDVAEGEAIMAKIAAGEFDAEEATAETPAAEVAMEVTTDQVEEKAEETEVKAVKEEEAEPELAAETVEAKLEEVKADEAKAEEVKEEDAKVDEMEVADDDKYTREDAPRRVFVKHIDRKKTSDDIEDYFFDNYTDCGLENVYTCMVFNARSQKKLFFGNVIVTFDTVENAKAFMTMKLRKEETMQWKRKLVRHSLEEVQKRREDRAASVVSTSGDPNTTFAKAAAAAGKPGTPAREVEVRARSIMCLNFPPALVEVERYMRECHESVRDVRREEVRGMTAKYVVTFKDQTSADRFLGLAYVKFRGQYITRSYHIEAKQERRAEKRKLEQPATTATTATTATATKARDTPNKEQEKRSVQFKLKGIFSEKTGYRDIKAILEQEHGLDVRFVSMAAGEARVRLLAGSDTAAQVVYRLAKDQITVNGEVLIPSSLTKEEEANPPRTKSTQKAKRERLPDWSDY